MPTKAHLTLARWHAEDSANRFWCLESSLGGMTLHVSSGDQHFTAALINVVGPIDVIDFAAARMLLSMEKRAESAA